MLLCIMFVGITMVINVIIDESIIVMMVLVIVMSSAMIRFTVTVMKLCHSVADLKENI